MATDKERPRVALVTFGCRVNQYETQMMRRLLAADFALSNDEADVYFLNACTVTSLAERKARQRAARIRREYPEAKVVLIGCLAEAVREGLAEAGDVDLVAGNAWKGHAPEVVRRALAGETGLLAPIAATPLACERIDRQPGRVRAFLKVEDGCSLSCAFCRTTQVRGAVQSKPVAAAVEEARALVANGCPEVVLTGVNLALCSPPDGTLADLVCGVLSVDGLRRLRLGSINLSGITDVLLAAFADDRRACPHFHIPLQSGDDGVLRQMRRGYTAGEYLAAMRRIRKALPEATFGADVLVGFPGEDEAAFAATLSLLEEVGFANLHVFRYSPRRGTQAATMAPTIPEAAKRERARRVEEVGRAIRLSLGDRLVGKTEEILVESRHEGLLRGYTRGYLKTVARGGSDVQVGEEIAVRVTGGTAEHLEGVREDRRDVC